MKLDQVLSSTQLSLLSKLSQLMSFKEHIFALPCTLEQNFGHTRADKAKYF